jgi:hypothetical protein
MRAFLPIALVLVLICTSAVLASKTKKSQVLQISKDKPAMLAEKLGVNKNAINKKINLLVETSSKAKAAQGQGNFGEDGTITAGNTVMDVANLENGQAVVDFTAELAFVTPTSSQGAAMTFQFDKVNEGIALNITAQTGGIAGDATTLATCQGYWVQQSHDMLNNEDELFLNNCFIYNAAAQTAIKFNMENIQSAARQYAATYTWVCNDEGKFWVFDINNCRWVEQPNPIINPNNVISFIETSHQE